MAYKKLKPHKMTINDLRSLWLSEYCNPEQPIYTFDKIRVAFYPEIFEHAFFESANREKGDKSILSYNRLEKMLWIKDVLLDTSAVLKVGWNRNTKSYDNSRRVAVVKNGYIVVILLTGARKARFITAYEIDSEANLLKILSSPNYEI